jgi:hypothetical protein
MRFLRWLKYVPLAVFIGLMGVWILSIFCVLGYSTDLSEGAISRGRIYVHGHSDDHVVPAQGFQWFVRQAGTYPDVLGNFEYSYKDHGSVPGIAYGYLVSVPLCWFLTALLPLVVGTWTGFRFRLWMYFAWVFLVALQLAYFFARPEFEIDMSSTLGASASLAASMSTHCL